MVHFIFDVVDQVIGNIRALDIAFDVFPEVFFLSKERRTFGININPLQQLLLVIAAQFIVEIHGDLLSQILIIAHAAIVLKLVLLLHFRALLFLFTVLTAVVLITHFLRVGLQFFF